MSAGIVLQVAVQRHDEAPARVRESGGERRRLAEVARELDHPDVRIARLDLRQPRERPVLAAVVDEDELVRDAERRQRRRSARSCSGRTLRSSSRSGMTTESVRRPSSMQRRRRSAARLRSAPASQPPRRRRQDDDADEPERDLAAARAHQLERERRRTRSRARRARGSAAPRATRDRQDELQRPHAGDAGHQHEQLERRRRRQQRRHHQRQQAVALVERQRALGVPGAAAASAGTPRRPSPPGSR